MGSPRSSSLLSGFGVTNVCINLISQFESVLQPLNVDTVGRLDCLSIAFV